MLQIPILRHGQPYTSIDTFDILHHATGQPVARVSQANPGLISRDISRMDHDILESFRMRELLDVCKKAAKIFMTADQEGPPDHYGTRIDATAKSGINSFADVKGKTVMINAFGTAGELAIRERLMDAGVSWDYLLLTINDYG